MGLSAATFGNCRHKGLGNKESEKPRASDDTTAKGKERKVENVSGEKGMELAKRGVGWEEDTGDRIMGWKDECSTLLFPSGMEPGF